MVRPHSTRRQAPGILTKAGPHGHVSERHFAASDVIDRIIGKACTPQGGPTRRLLRSARIELPRRFKQRGALSIRGAAEGIASGLNVSAGAIYNYLREFD